MHMVSMRVCALQTVLPTPIQVIAHGGGPKSAKSPFGKKVADVAGFRPPPGATAPPTPSDRMKWVAAFCVLESSFLAASNSSTNSKSSLHKQPLQTQKIRGSAGGCCSRFGHALSLGRKAFLDEDLWKIQRILGEEEVKEATKYQRPLFSEIYKSSTWQKYVSSLITLHPAFLRFEIVHLFSEKMQVDKVTSLLH